MTTTEPANDPTGPRPPIWQRHRGLSIAAVVIVIVLITVITDLPTGTSRASDVSAERSVMSEVNSDLQPCAYSIHQALGIWALAATHQLSAADRAPTPGLLGDDQSACSLTNESTYDLASNIQTPSTAAGKELAQVIATATLWTTSDALRAIEAVQTLMNDPGNVAAQQSLKKAETQLARDRRTALAAEGVAERDLDTDLAPVDLPAEPSSG
ncbi:MAG TPA: hypothetical protein VMP41_16100 [Acidimicrobiales bacterium]|jgi:hypothetical protein|nr:hypothetical protein [Acidimicrobiales bacterium]